MSTSHYSRPYQGPTPPPNTRKYTGTKLAIIGGLLLIDLLACIGANNLGEAATFAGLAIVNLWALNWSR
jgi:hypothetical protein